ncbi:MAG TPA: hypothetical protein VGD89_14105 [Flavipsychrobacter sp.]
MGHISVTEPTGLDAMLTVYTAYIDDLLRRLPLDPLQYLTLITSRSFTYDEYKALWTVKQYAIKDTTICKVLLITTEDERLLFTSVALDDSHENFVRFLEIYTKNSNHFLHNLIYEIYA